jgi:hypothetical protein
MHMSMHMTVRMPMGMSMRMIVIVTMTVPVVVMASGSVHAPKVDCQPNTGDQQELLSVHLGRIQAGMSTLTATDALLRLTLAE